MRKILFHLAFFLFFTMLVHAERTRGSTPKDMQGIWSRSSECTHRSDLLIIKEKSASLFEPKFRETFYAADDGLGRSALHWLEEGDTDNFQYDRSTDSIVWNSQGYGMPGRLFFHRCSRNSAHDAKRGGRL